jgi:DnaJ-class molecular chaperone
MTEGIAHLVVCSRCKGEGVLPAVISLGGGFAPGIVCPKCKGERILVVGSCTCDEEHEPDVDAEEDAVE